jgi:hypothetical protein
VSRTAGACLALAAAALGACGGGDRPPASGGFDKSALERSLTREMARRTGTTVELMACPPVRAPRAGLTFECSAAFNAEPGVVIVTLVDAGARPPRYRARLKNLLLGQLELTLQRRLREVGTPVASIDCPGPVPQRRGQVSYCHVEDPRGRPGTLRVVQTDDDGTVRTEQVRGRRRR